MLNWPANRIAALGAIVVLSAAPLSLTATDSQAAALPQLHCRAHMSDATPKQYTNTYVMIRTAPRARARAVAHYKTTTTAHARRANIHGRVSLEFGVSGATPGRRVPVTVTVTKRGHRAGYCRTSFTPHR